MKLKSLLWLLAVSAAMSCSKEAADGDVPSETVPEALPEAFYTSEIEVKLSEEMAAEVEEESASGTPYTKSSHFGSLADRLGIISIEKIFTEDERFAERQHRAGLHQWYKVTIGPGSGPVTKAAGSLLDVPGILEAVPCRPVRKMAFDDPRFPSQWGLYQESGVDINVTDVWSGYTCGSDNVIVSVVDGGVTPGHEDLTVIPAGPGGSRNFISNSYSVSPDDHGYHVSGIIAATNNNSVGVCGIAGGDAANGIPGVKILSCQVFQGDEGGNFADAIRYGADNGAVISQNSWGNYYDLNEDGVVSGSELENAKNDRISGALKAAVDYFTDYAGCDNDGNQLPDSPMKGGVVIFAAGNENIPYGVPGSYERVIAVGSMDKYGRRSSFSNYGDWVDICAPGSDILSTVPDGYASMNGTSMACPHVSGVAALLVSYFGGPGFTNEMLKDRLLNGANRELGLKSIGPLLDALGSFTYGGTIPPDRVESYEAEGESGRIRFTWSVTADEDNTKAYGYLLMTSEDKDLLENADPKSLPEGIVWTTVFSGDKMVGEPIEGVLPGLDFSTGYSVCIIGFDYQNNYSEPSVIKTVSTSANSAPVISSAETGILEVRPFETVRRAYIVTEPDSHEMTVSFIPGSDAATFVEGVAEGEYVLAIVGNLADPGLYKAEITAVDEFGAGTSETVEYRILENRSPVIAGEPENMIFTSVGEEAVIDMTTLIADPDGEKLAWSISNSNPAVVHLTVSGNTVYATSRGFGNADVTVTGTDARGEYCSISFKIAVKNPDSPLELFPNPVTDYLNVRTMEIEDTRIRLISPSGKTVYDGTSPVGVFEPAVIDMREFAPGRYTAEISFGGNKYTRTVVKL